MFSVVLKKHHRQIALSACQALNCAGTSARYFSNAQPSQEELAKNREEWGEKYSDECFQFEKEWKQISDKIENE